MAPGRRVKCSCTRYKGILVKGKQGKGKGERKGLYSLVEVGDNETDKRHEIDEIVVKGQLSTAAGARDQQEGASTTAARHSYWQIFGSCTEFPVEQTHASGQRCRKY